MLSCNNNNNNNNEIKIERVPIKSQDDNDDGVTFIEQYVKQVCDFSSQYGSSNSISYTAYNIAGNPSKFPDYGDYPQAFVMRTYGAWWDDAPSRLVDFMPQNNEPFKSHDYIDVEYYTEVYPIRVSIFETYNPGSVVRIWAKNSMTNKWQQLWNGPTQLVPHKSRIFSPALELSSNFKTKYLRIEFNHNLLDYYTELDAILLIGTQQLILPHVGFKNRNLSELLQVLDCTTHTPDDPLNLTPDYLRLNCDLHKLKETLHKHCVLYKSNINNQQLLPRGKLITKLGLDCYCIPPIEEAFNSLQQFLQQDFPKLIHEINSSSTDEITNNCENFSMLPDETMLKILKNLDLKSLCRCCRINKHFNNIARDALLYKSLNLKPYWNCIDSLVLANLAPKCKYLQKLNLSWCGGYSNQLITTSCAVEFLNSCGTLLTHLRLDSCYFVDDYFIKEISFTCKNLKELCLRNCGSITRDGFNELDKLCNLERLELYRTLIETAAMCAILKNNPGIKHLNLAGLLNEAGFNMDNVAIEIANSCPNIESIDCWKCQTLSPSGIRALTQCTKLCEVDFGWCGGIGAPGDSLRIFLTNCHLLKKVFLGAVRGINDRDIEPLLLCYYLEQLDLLGARSLSSDICLRFLLCCPRLKMMDLSFCDGISESKIQEWRKLYPHVSIKRSFQTRDDNRVSPLYP